MLLTGDIIDAAEAKTIGLINKVIRAQSFRKKTDEFISKLTSLSGPVLRLTKRAVDRGLFTSVNDGIKTVEELYLGELMQTADAHEGLNAFLEKHKPIWKNK